MEKAAIWKLQKTGRLINMKSHFGWRRQALSEKWLEPI
jgi:hypothetical protein